jgi:fused signal recognition particle receptor
VFDRLKQGLHEIVDKISNSNLNDKDLEPILWDLQLKLVSNDVSLEVAERISDELKNKLLEQKAPRFGDKSSIVKEALRESIKTVLESNSKVDLYEMLKIKKQNDEPFIILFVGINGTGKTTTIAKLAYILKETGYSVVLASADTYRAGAIEQLEEHAKLLNVKIIKHRYGSDAAAVGFDAVQHARAQGIDVVLIDTAGRMQTNRNLMDELQKIKRVVQPDLTIIVLDSLIGNDASEQAVTFEKHIGFDAAILTKIDADAKGGSSISVSYLTDKPIIFVGIGQGYNDLESFEAEIFIERILEMG